MNFTLPSAILGVAELLRDRIGPEIGDNYTANMARMATAVLNISANWIDDAAALRVAENAAIRELLGEGAGPADPGLRICELDRENHRLRLILVALHIDLEVRQDADSRAMDQRIWRLLEDIETKRAPRE
jgi:hypothetical protein